MRTCMRWSLKCLQVLGIGIVVCAGLYLSAVVVFSEHRNAAQEQYDRELYRQMVADAHE